MEASLSTVFSGDVLIVEDNFIIAMDVEELVTELGAAHVHIANTAQAALSVIDSHVLDAALLDFNLNDETSVSVADALIATGVRFVFASGYSDETVIPDRFSDYRLLKKPYSKSDIADVFSPEE